MTENTDSGSGSTGRLASVQGLKDLIERTFLAGMGAAALTKDRVQELVEDLVTKGQINADEGREVVDRLMTRSREEAKSVIKKVDSSLHSAYREAGIGSNRDLEALALRLDQLEHRIGLLEEQADTGSGVKS
jgi:polyhydroxyalkanoate synthesis regulator phasin